MKSRALSAEALAKASYAYIYISNENPNLIDVYFDDMTVTHTKSPVIQYNEYYPYGLQNSQSWTRENNSNNFLYNAGTELNPASGLYDLFFRNYDPSVGRMSQVDPVAGKFGGISPYGYAGNDPVFFNDPAGDDYTITINWDMVPDEGYHWRSSGPQDAHAGPYGSSWDSFQSADANFDALNGVGNSLYNEMTYGQTAGGRATPSTFGPGYSPGIFGGSARGSQEGWVPKWLVKYVEYEDGVTRVLSVKLIGFVKTMERDGFVSRDRDSSEEFENPLPDEEIWHRAVHSKSQNFSVIREFQIKHTNFGYIKTTRVAIVLYGEGTKHKVVKFGYQTKTYYLYDTVEKWEKSPFVNTVLGPKFNISEAFLDQIKIAVNSYLGFDYYVDLVEKSRLIIGPPRERQKSKWRDPRGPEYH